MIRWLGKLLLLPVQVLALATQAKSFEHNPVIGNPWLNRMGLHVLRVVLAHGAMRVRRALLSRRLPAELRSQFRQQGFLMLTDVLDAEHFDRLREEAERMLANPSLQDTQQGDTRTWQLFLDNEVLQEHPAFAAALRSKTHSAALAYVAGRFRTPFHWLQQIGNGVIPTAEADPQRRLHSDTFQPAMKAWLFISEADEHNGAFTYVPGSHRLSRRRLAWEYRQSLVGRKQPTPYAARGSFRIDPQALPELGLPPPQALPCPANTLIVADTFGFHCRGPAGQADARRLELWSLCRPNPFNPLPGLPFACLSRLERKVYPQFESLRLKWRMARMRRRQD